MKNEVLSIILFIGLVLLILTVYAMVGGFTAAWYNHANVGFSEKSIAATGILWPISLPIVVGVQVYQWVSLR